MTWIKYTVPLLALVVLFPLGINNTYAQDPIEEIEPRGEGPVGTVNEEITTQEQSEEIQSLLELSETNLTDEELTKVTEKLNELGIPTTQQLESDFELWTIKSIGAALFEDPFKEQINTVNALYESDNSEIIDTQCRKCNPQQAAFFPGVWVDCGRDYQCSYSVDTWKKVKEHQTRQITFSLSSSDPSPDARGWYYAQGPQRSTLVDWTDIYSIPESSFERSHNYEEDIDPQKFKQLERVNNNPQNFKVGFTFSVHDIQ